MEVRRVLRAQTHELEPRKMWPGGAFGARGRIPAGEAVHTGRLLVHADAPEWASSLAGSLAGRGAVEPELLEAAVTTLVAWRGQWPARPEVVIALDAARLPGVAAGVAEHLGAVGRLPVATWWWVGDGPPEGASSAREAAYWRGVFAENPPPSTKDRRVLLVVDATGSGWSVTLAGAALRREGAPVVLPLVVHRRV